LENELKLLIHGRKEINELIKNENEKKQILDKKVNSRLIRHLLDITKIQ
jgi:hypothetical protein